MVTCFLAAVPGASQVPFGSPGALERTFEILIVQRWTPRGSRLPRGTLRNLATVLIHFVGPGAPKGSFGPPRGLWSSFLELR